MDLQVNLQRQLTKVFIDLDPTVIRLIPRGIVRDASGADMTVDLPARPPQTFKLVQQTNTVTGGVHETGDGRQRQTEYVLVAEYNAVVGVDDYWQDAEGTRWEVVGRVDDNGYELKFGVRRYLKRR